MLRRLQRPFLILVLILSARSLLAQSTPSITSFSPTGGPVGTPVTLAVSGFGASQGSSTVTFNGVAGTQPVGVTQASPCPCPRERL
jgi:hypothetical protein